MVNNRWLGYMVLLFLSAGLTACCDEAAEDVVQQSSVIVPQAAELAADEPSMEELEAAQASLMVDGNSDVDTPVIVQQEPVAPATSEEAPVPVDISQLPPIVDVSVDVIATEEESVVSAPVVEVVLDPEEYERAKGRMMGAWLGVLNGMMSWVERSNETGAIEKQAMDAEPTPEVEQE